MVHMNQPIGVFDSGIGGLTVLKELRQALPDEHLIYVGDLARSPYGSKSPETVKRYASQIARYLLSRNVKMIIIACNTASATAGELVRQLAAPVPVLEVVEQGADAALDVIAAMNEEEARVGILGTVTTVTSGIYPDMVRALAERREMAVPSMLQKACPLFVPLAEEGIWEGELADRVADLYLEEVKSFQPHVVILGCTHYPLLRGAIAGALPSGTTLIESAPAVVRTARRILEEAGLKALQTSGAVTEYHVSDSVDTFRRNAGRILDTNLDLVHHINLDACEDREE
ncbi:MAG: glutamate racemase [Clostridiaceae bacterium]|nr:glutamate racemase [Clostridiaceae bacterium]